MVVTINNHPKKRGKKPEKKKMSEMMRFIATKMKDLQREKDKDSPANFR
jgi:hypothetical protein